MPQPPFPVWRTKRICRKTWQTSSSSQNHLRLLCRRQMHWKVQSLPNQPQQVWSLTQNMVYVYARESWPGARFVHPERWTDFLWGMTIPDQLPQFTSKPTWTTDLGQMTRTVGFRAAEIQPRVMIFLCIFFRLSFLSPDLIIAAKVVGKNSKFLCFEYEWNDIFRSWYLSGQR